MRILSQPVVLSLFALLSHAAIVNAAGETSSAGKCLTPAGKIGFFENKKCVPCADLRIRRDVCKSLPVSNQPARDNGANPSKQGLTDNAGGLTKPTKIITTK